MPGAAFPEARFHKLRFDPAHELHVGAIGELRMVLQRLAARLPVEVEALHEHHAVWVAQGHRQRLLWT